MAEKSWLWTTGGAGDGSTTYTRTDWSNIIKVVSECHAFEGVSPGFLNSFAATPSANNVSIASGGAVVDGKPYLNDAAVNVNIPSAVGGGNTRIDRIVLRADWTSQTVRITRIAGTDAASPVPPAITQNPGSVYDIKLYQVTVDTAGNVTVTTEERVYTQIANADIAPAAGIVGSKIAAGAISNTQINDLAAINGTKLKNPTAHTDPYGAQAFWHGDYNFSLSDGSSHIVITAGALTPIFYSIHYTILENTNGKVVTGNCVCWTSNYAEVTVDTNTVRFTYDASRNLVIQRTAGSANITIYAHITANVLPAS